MLYCKAIGKDHHDQKLKSHYHQYIKILVVCASVTDVGVAVTDLRVVCKSITCVSAFTEAFTKIAIIFLEIVKSAAGLDNLHCRLREGCHCGCLPLH